MPSLEVRGSGGGHPPVTIRERELHLNGTGGVILFRARFSDEPGSFF